MPNIKLFDGSFKNLHILVNQSLNYPAVENTLYWTDFCVTIKKMPSKHKQNNKGTRHKQYNWFHKRLRTCMAFGWSS